MTFKTGVDHYNFKHGEGHPASVEYQAWRSMKKRCLIPSDEHYPDYGARGISVCQAWLESYEAFLAHVGRRPSPNHSLDRKDNNGNYEPGNVHWTTIDVQQRNRRSNRFISFRGETMCLEDWARRLGIAQSSLWARLDKWGIEEALTKPKRK